MKQFEVQSRFFHSLRATENMTNKVNNYLLHLYFDMQLVTNFPNGLWAQNNCT